LRGTSHIYQTLGLAYYNKKDYSRSISNLEEATAIIKPFKNEQLLSELFFYKGRSFYKLNKTDQAIVSLKVSEEILIKKDTINEFSILLADTYKLIAEIYKKNNNHKESGIYFEKHIALNQQKNKSKLNTIQNLYTNNLQSKNKIIADLSSKQRILQNKKIISLLIYFFIFFIAISIVFYFLQKTKKNREQMKSDLVINKHINTKVIKRIDSEKAKNILISLENLENTEFFLNENFSLATVAKKLKTNSSYISRTVNIYKNQTFQEYASELRINYVINRLKKDRKFRLYSVQHIAKEIGYKSPNSFTKHFKKKTGIYPSSFIANIDDLQLNNLLK